ncbi:hypothetical protein ACSBR2_029479 [Camellia fascicularis]
MPYHSLPDSIKTSNCRIVYLCRNPYDSFVSAWHFFSKLRLESLEPLSCNDAFDMYCRGVIGYGPFWDNVMGYWKESLKRPQKVLFLMYEDLKEDIIFQMKRLVEFMSIPFSLEEESEGVIEEISRLCNFNNMRELEVNKTGKSLGHFENEMLFRRDEVGDWINHFTPEMVERLNKVIEEKLSGSGLAFKTIYISDNGSKSILTLLGVDVPAFVAGLTLYQTYTPSFLGLRNNFELGPNWQVVEKFQHRRIWDVPEFDEVLQDDEASTVLPTKPIDDDVVLCRDDIELEIISMEVSQSNKRVQPEGLMDDAFICDDDDELTIAGDDEKEDEIQSDFDTDTDVEF